MAGVQLNKMNRRCWVVGDGWVKNNPVQVDNFEHTRSSISGLALTGTRTAVGERSISPRCPSKEN